MFTKIPSMVPPQDHHGIGVFRQAAHLAANPDPAWAQRLAATDATWRARFIERVDESDDLSEAWLARALVRRLDGAGAALLTVTHDHDLLPKFDRHVDVMEMLRREGKADD